MDNKNSEKQSKIYTQEDFLKEYKELVDRTGWQINSDLSFFPQDNGTFSLKLSQFVVKK